MSNFHIFFSSSWKIKNDKNNKITKTLFWTDVIKQKC